MNLGTCAISYIYSSEDSLGIREYTGHTGMSKLCWIGNKKCTFLTAAENMLGIWGTMWKCTEIVRLF